MQSFASRLSDVSLSSVCSLGMSAAIMLLFTSSALSGFSPRLVCTVWLAVVVLVRIDFAVFGQFLVETLDDLGWLGTIANILPCKRMVCFF